MEPLWSPVVATGGDRSQNTDARKPRRIDRTLSLAGTALKREPSRGSSSNPVTSTRTALASGV